MRKRVLRLVPKQKSSRIRTPRIHGTVLRAPLSREKTATLLSETTSWSAQLLLLTIPQELKQSHHVLVPNKHRETPKSPLPLILANLL